jgi:hypothetical protein
MAYCTEMQNQRLSIFKLYILVTVCCIILNYKLGKW